MKGGMTKLETRNRPERRFSSFVIRHSFGLRHSPARRSRGKGGSFVISSTARLVLVLLMALCVSCSGKRITKANVDEITQGMSRKQVESVLGPPTSRMTDVYVYRQGKDIVSIVFKDDKVQSKKSTLSD
jgi:hypothetical protein